MDGHHYFFSVDNSLPLPSSSVHPPSRPLIASTNQRQIQRERETEGELLGREDGGRKRRGATVPGGEKRTAGEKRGWLRPARNYYYYYYAAVKPGEWWPKTIPRALPLLLTAL